MGSSKRNRKVAYAVFRGRTPGVYDTWNEAQRNTKGVSGAKLRGYTIDDGGREQAEKDFNEQQGPTWVIDDANTEVNNVFIGRSNENLGNTQESAESDGRLSIGESGPALQNSQTVNDISQAKKRPWNESEVAEQEIRRGKSPRLNDVQYPALPVRQHTPQDHPDYPSEFHPSCHNSSQNTPSADKQTKHDYSTITSIDERRMNEVVQIIDLLDEEPSNSSLRASSTPDFDAFDSSDYSSDYSSYPSYPVLPPPSAPASSAPALSAPPSSAPPPSAPPPSATQLPVTEPKLCKEQADLVELILSGANVFYTGSAGCGKSTVLRSFVGQLKSMGKTVKIIAPTGRSALDVSGTTFWTYAGWHPDSMKLPLETLEDNARYHEHVRERLCKTDVLVIDEISMFENEHFERLNRIMKAARSYNERTDVVRARAKFDAPFGGVQMVVTGDFCQLPPVRPYTYCMKCGQTLHVLQGGTVYRCPKHGEFYDVDKWTFRSTAWQECRFKHVNLTQIHRQSDKQFITILNKFRYGRPLSVEDKNLLLNHPSETAHAVRLFPLVSEVRKVNDREFSRLKGLPVVFDCLDDHYWNQAHVSLKYHWQRNDDQKTLKALDHHRFEANLQLKPKMLVVLLVNLDIERGLVNGSQGVVLGFKTIDHAQLPEQVGEHAGRKKAQMNKFVDRAKVKQWPLVRFHNGVTRLIKAYCAISELGESKPYSLISRTQIPLVAAWAMTIHKSQGMTLSRVDVNISRVFEKGQGYVALSRATSLHGLNVRALGSCDKGCNEQVMEFLLEKFGEDAIEGMVS